MYRMTTLAKVVYLLGLGGFAALAILGLLAGGWLYPIVALLFGAAFAYAAPFFLARRWRPPPPRPTRRPVRRRPH